MIRKLSIDEHPAHQRAQGDMSIVGPAEIPHFVEQFRDGCRST
ncbi:MAG: hypothetical protein ACLS6G_13755 [Christensenellales bacterium]